MPPLHGTPDKGEEGADGAGGQAGGAGRRGTETHRLCRHPEITASQHFLASSSGSAGTAPPPPPQQFPGHTRPPHGGGGVGISSFSHKHHNTLASCPQHTPQVSNFALKPLRNR